MSLELMHNLYERLDQSDFPISSKNRASVAAIFRIIPSSVAPTSLSSKTLDFFSDSFLKHPHLLSGKLQLFFIRRALNPRDLHSGQIAFPGGKREGNESSVATAIRETFEEVGINLDSPDFLYLGRTGESNPYTFRNKKELMLSTHGNG